MRLSKALMHRPDSRCRFIVDFFPETRSVKGNGRAKIHMTYRIEILERHSCRSVIPRRHRRLFRMQPRFASIPLVLCGASASAASIERQATSLIDWHVSIPTERNKRVEERRALSPSLACIYIFSILNDWSPAYYH